MDKLLRATRASTRGVHHRVTPSKYPKVNAKDVDLNPPRYGFRKERPPLLSQSVTDTLFPAEKIKQLYKEAGKPVPIKQKGNNDKVARRNYEKFKEEVAMGLPHFKVGENKIYFPKGRVCLLRPNAKHTPYQAKFIVPRSFNKMDLRDYLWHLYGLRALNVTVQLLHAPYTRGEDDVARHRQPQYKKMTIDMDEPFVWPALPEDLEESAKRVRLNQARYMERFTGGSSGDKPTGAFDGLYDKPNLPNIFVSRRASRELLEKVSHIRARDDLLSERARLAHHLKL